MCFDQTYPPFHPNQFFLSPHHYFTLPTSYILKESKTPEFPECCLYKHVWRASCWSIDSHSGLHLWRKLTLPSLAATNCSSVRSGASLHPPHEYSSSLKAFNLRAWASSEKDIYCKLLDWQEILYLPLESGSFSEVTELGPNRFPETKCEWRCHHKERLLPRQRMYGPATTDLIFYLLRKIEKNFSKMHHYVKN